MHFKASFRRDLERLYCVLGEALARDDNYRAECSYYLVPVLYRFSSLLWSHKFKEYLKK